MKFYLLKKECDFLNYILSFKKDKFDSIQDGQEPTYEEFCNIIFIKNEDNKYYIENTPEKIYGLQDFFMNYTVAYGFKENYELNEFGAISDDLYDKLYQHENRFLFWVNIEDSFTFRYFFSIIKINGKDCETKSGLFKTFREKLKIPAYFEDTWEDFKLYTNDLHWLSDDGNIKHVFIDLYNVDYFLKKEELEKCKFFNTVVNGDLKNFKYDVRINFIIQEREREKTEYILKKCSII